MKDWRTQCLYSTINCLTLSLSTLCVCKIRPNIKQTLYHTHTLNKTHRHELPSIGRYSIVVSRNSRNSPLLFLRVVNSVRSVTARVGSWREHPGPVSQSGTDSRAERTPGKNTSKLRENRDICELVFTPGRVIITDSESDSEHKLCVNRQTRRIIVTHGKNTIKLRENRDSSDTSGNIK